MKSLQKILKILTVYLVQEVADFVASRTPLLFTSYGFLVKQLVKTSLRKHEPQDTRWIRIRCDSKCKCQWRLFMADVFGRIVTVLVRVLPLKFYRF